MKIIFPLLVILSFCFFCYSCNNSQHLRNEDVYVMPKYISANEDGKMEYYLTYNFIIDTDSHIYFYQREPNFSGCGTVDWTEEIRIPHYINLQPSDIIEISSINLEEFVKSNILTAEKWKREVIICSPTDTVFSEGLSRILKIFKDTANHVEWKFRKTTQEEDFALNYKKSPYSYYGDNGIEWDSTKTLFFKVIERIRSEETDSLLRFYKTKNFQTTQDSLESYFGSDGLMDSVKLKKWAAYLRLQDSIRFRKVAAALRVKVEDVYINEEKR